MTRRGLILCSLLTLAGCQNEKDSTALVAPNPFSGPKAQIVQVPLKYPSSNAETAAYIDTLGRKVLAANPQIGLRPFFSAIASPDAEIFHQNTSRIIVTEGLVKQCKTEAELAALICRELGKMVSEREALASPDTRNSRRLPPIQLHIANDPGAGIYGGTGSEYYEMAKYEKENPRRGPNTPPPLPPDPLVLARCYLKKAGYPEAAVDQALPLFKAADKNSTWEKQMNVPPNSNAPVSH